MTVHGLELLFKSFLIMTWLVIAPTLLGYSVAVSDIRVTFADKDKSERDCLQKIYPIAPNMALGFSGSVRIGLAMVARAQDLLQDSSRWRMKHPAQFAVDWPRFARRLYSDEHFNGERHLGCNLALVGASRRSSQIFSSSVRPTRKTTVAEPGSYAYVFRRPKFCPSRIPFGKITSIGSGVTAYGSVLESIWKTVLPMHLQRRGRIGDRLGRELVERLSVTLSSGKQPGISRIVQYARVAPSGVQISHLVPFIGPLQSKHALRNFTFIKPADREPMPDLARNWDEFNALASQLGLESGRASAVSQR